MTTSEEIEQLAATIGEVVYLEVAKWRLYANDAHLHVKLAEEIAPLIEAHKLERERIAAIFASTPITLGSGKTVPLLDFVPERVITQLWEILIEDDR
ncbi:MAG: DUF3181 family protein [Pseudanabaenaceae cyanobacterium SKYGB_i_bin29]|nr:DUF3181 family protein [Pseudanabaenaceae cyanobacterium SKYG29]MDW8422436.1 DUF3181 family protein [Pseudanabaenaceae cyanobacterium SKYGB_i_bin29]